FADNAIEQGQRAALAAVGNAAAGDRIDESILDLDAYQLGSSGSRGERSGQIVADESLLHAHPVDSIKGKPGRSERTRPDLRAAPRPSAAGPGPPVVIVVWAGRTGRMRSWRSSKGAPRSSPAARRASASPSRRCSSGKGRGS